MNSRTSSLLAGASLAAAAACAQAATPATTPAPTETAAPAAVATAPDAGGERRFNELFYQLQVLQQEVQELRGLVEEQSYQLNRLARDQQEQYLDLDRRVASLTTGGAAAPNVTSVPTPTTRTPASGVTGGASAQPSAAASGLSERDAYTRAFDMMKARQFDESTAAFQQLIVEYPNGQYTPNAYYWLGELHLAQQSNEEARQAFMQVVNLYPDHPKVPDTLYKLGVTYHRLGDNANALTYFNRVRSEYPASSAAGLATSYAAELR